MTEIKSKPEASTRSVADLANMHFIVEAYQRGYKWTPQQVFDLMEDVSGFDPNKDAFYCLQPLALVARENNKSFEVIDGQQRLATIYIIQTLLDRCEYKIDYKTRKSSEEFLGQMGELGGKHKQNPIKDYQSISDFEKQCVARWKDYLEKPNQETADNPDNFYFFQAMQTVLSWSAANASKVDKLKNQLKENTRFIWYVERKESNPKAVFRNLNSGKIILTNAELLKAEIINGMKDDSPEVLALRQNELATEWDQIEQALHDDSFWFFINNETDNNRYETRIDFLFELLLDRAPGKSYDQFYTYRAFSKRMALGPDSDRLDWEAVRLAFFQLREWYEEDDTYHLIGYIIDRKIKKIRELFESSKGCWKNKFKDELKNIISNDFAGFYFNKDSGADDDPFLAQLRYKKNSPNPWIDKVLLLYNLELYQTSHANYRFPFDRFKQQKWSLEHIHAQNSEDLATIGEAQDWRQSISDLKTSFASLVKDNDEQSFPDQKWQEIEISVKAHTGSDDDQIPDKLKSLMNEVSENLEEYFDMHAISNLALLDGPTNSAFGKKAFAKKREKLIAIDRQPWQMADKDKVFIPIGTKNVFLKHTSHSLDQLSVWGAQDRADYYAHIETVLKGFLPNQGSSRGRLDALIVKSLEMYTNPSGGSDE